MHLNGDSMESLLENHEMLEAENRSLADRVSDLERKVLEQNDELMCLKATLAEALRRISQLETLSLSATAANTTPSSSPFRKDNIKLRPHSISKAGSAIPLDNGQRRSFAGSALPQRRAVHYQSTGSLHSDSHSSSSVSPAPSPSPRATPLPKKSPQTQPSTTITTITMNSNSNLHKRWSSTGDFYHNNIVAPNMQSKFTTKSVLNLYSKTNHFSTSNFKHGTKEAIFNNEEKTVKMYLRGRPLTFPTPSTVDYDISKVLVAPSQKLKLEWVYGYRGRDCRLNLYYLPTGEMVYFVAAIVVLYNVEEQYQRHYLGHTDDIKCLAIHPSKMLIATGQNGGTNRKETIAHIRIWNSVSLNTQTIIGMNEFDMSVCCLSFSKLDGGTYLLAVDDASDHTISIWDWQKGEHGQKITETKCSVDTIVAAEFHPLDRNIIVTCGKSHIAFWSLDNNGGLFKRIGIFDNREKPKYVTCVSFLQTGETITGDSNGNLAIWTRGTNTIWKFIKNVHDGPIFSICVLKDGSVVTGGGKDGRIIYFNNYLQKTTNLQIEGHFGGIRVISEGCGTQLIIGTTKNCILNGSFDLGFQPIIFGHTDEIWGLAAHPKIQQFATVGYDKVLQLWDSLSYNILWSKDIGEHAQSIAYSNDGSFIVVGCTSGKWIIYDTQTRELIGQYIDGGEPIQTIEFSPDANMIALGSKDGQIYIYEMSETKLKFNRIGRCSGHSSFITHIDWSEDSQYLRSNSGDYELLYWNASICRQITQSTTMRDVKWHTNRCTLTFSTIGIWPEGIDGIDVNCCDCNSNKKLLASGDDFGKVKLFSYPVIQPKSLCHIYGGHSSQVTGVAFLYDDTRLVSIGGKDTAVLQWTVF